MDSINKISTADIGHQSKVVIANHRITTVQTTQTKPNQADTNFEYEDNEWDIGIGDLIIDLDADIEKSSNVESSLMIPLQKLADQSKLVDSNLSNCSSSSGQIDKESTICTMSSNNKNSSKVSVDNHQATLDKGLKMKIKRTKLGNKTSDSKHEIVKSDNEVGVGEEQLSKCSTLIVNKRGNNNHKKEKQTKAPCKDKEGLMQDSSCSCENESSPCSSCKEQTPLNEKGNPACNTFSTLIKEIPTFNMKEQKGLTDNETLATSGKGFNDEELCDDPPVKRPKCDLKDMVDVCIGTSVGTITEPDCLGPCEPGTSVTLEGIVWHESEGGVLAVNVTWRGKTYVGTLIDCTKHDWAPPRFCDSPEDIESRLQKSGRSKRRTATNDLLNFTETRSSVHSKLRNGSKVPKQDKRRKSKDESPSSSNGSSFQTSIVNHNANNFANSQKPSNTKKTKSLVTPCAVSPVLIECPEQDCSKKYKHANGLKYHQSHAHGTNLSPDDDMNAAPESPNASCGNNNVQDIIEEKSSELEQSSINKKSFAQKDEGNTNDALDVVLDKAKVDTNIEEHSSNSNSTRVVDESIPIAKSPISSKAQNTMNIEGDGLSNESSVDPNFFQTSSQGTKTNINAVKCKKNRKSPPITALENVRSPAYSDISDDSTPIDCNNMDKTVDLQKNNPESSGSMMLGNYNHLSYYQPPTFLHSGDHIKSINHQLNNQELKEHTPLDLISKMHLEKGSIEQRNSSPLNTKSVQFQHFPFNIVQNNFSFNGDSSFGSRAPSLDGEKDSHSSVKNEKESEPPNKQMKSLIKLEDSKEIKIEPDQSPQHSVGFSNYSKFTSSTAPSRDEDIERYFASNDRKRNIIPNTLNNKSLKEEFNISNNESSQGQQNQKMGPNKSVISSASKSHKDIKTEEKEIKSKNEGQKPTMETQGPPPPPTNQYYLPYHLTGSGNGPPFFTDHAIYRNMLVPSSYNSPYHLQMARFSSPEDLSSMSRNPTNTKALDLLQQHASQYYNTHKIHELNDRANQLAKSSSSNVSRLPSVGAPNSSVILGNNSIPALSSNTSGTTNSQPSSLSSNCDANKIPPSVSNTKLLAADKDNSLNRTSSPPPQRHHHTHHHTHVYPIYGAPYVNPSVLAQPAVAVINPFANPPPK